MSFSYQQVLVELIYAYLIARYNIGYAVRFQARFSQNPLKKHYLAVKGVAKYL